MKKIMKMSEKVFDILRSKASTTDILTHHFNWSRVLDTTDILTRQYVPGL